MDGGVLVSSCGARVIFHGLIYRDPRWTRYGSQCVSACFDRSEACERTCALRHTDANDELTEEGALRIQHCREAEAKCMERCPPG